MTPMVARGFALDFFLLPDFFTIRFAPNQELGPYLKCRAKARRYIKEIDSFRSARCRKEFVDRSERIFFALRNFGGEAFEFAFAFGAVKNLFEETGLEQAEESIFPMLLMFFLALATRFEVDAEFFDGGGKCVDSGVFRSDGSNHGRMPAVSRHDERKHGVKLLLETVGALPVGFVENEDVGDFHEAGFHGLDVVAETGNEDDDDTIGEANDINFVLTNADGFDEDLFFTGGVEDECDFGRGARKSAEKTARGHRADKDAVVAGVALHADAIAENGATGVGACGIDRDHADGLLRFAVVSGEAIDKSALACAGSAGDAGKIRCAGMREKILQERFGIGRVVFDGGDGPRDGADFAGADLLRPGFNWRGHVFLEARRPANDACFYYGEVEVEIPVKRKGQETGWRGIQPTNRSRSGCAT